MRITRKISTIVVLTSIVLLGGCATSPSALPDSPETPSRAEDIMTDSDGLPEAAPAFAAHFTDPIYSDPADEFAPFGTDEGWDLLHEWAERRDELRSTTTVAHMLCESGFEDIVSNLDAGARPGIPEPGGSIDAATIVVGAGFTLLRLTGDIDEVGLRQTLAALDVLIDYYGSPEPFLVQRRDLESWTP